MNPLHQVPPRVRAWVYGLFAALSLGVGAAQVGYAAVPADAPTWLTVALAVVPFVGAGIGATAATHVPTAPDAVAQREARHALPSHPEAALLAADRVPGPDHRTGT